MRLIATLAATLLLAGCGLVYRMDIQQGNFVAKEAAAKLQVGMSKAEVRQLLGTPLLIDAFHANRWDYLFTNEFGRTKENPSRLTIVFQNDKVASFTGEGRETPPTVRTQMLGTPPPTR